MWNTRRECIEDVEALGKESTHVLGDEPIIDQWACDKLRKAVKNQITEVRSPKHPVGEMRWWRTSTGKKLALISGVPKVSKGAVVYPCLVDGEIIDVPTGNLLKRRGK